MQLPSGHVSEIESLLFLISFCDTADRVSQAEGGSLGEVQFSLMLSVWSVEAEEAPPWECIFPISTLEAAQQNEEDHLLRLC